MVYSKLYSILLSLFLILSFSPATFGMKEDKDQEREENKKIPSVFAVYQQQGPVCPQIAFTNLKKVRKIRERGNGEIVFKESDYVSKIRSYALFLPMIRILDHAYDNLRENQGAYANYEQSIRLGGIKNNHQYTKEGKLVSTIDFFSIDKARRKAFTPYNIKIEKTPVGRWLPLFHNREKEIYFYDFVEEKTRKLGPICEEEINSQTDHYLYFFDKNAQLSPMFCRFDEEVLAKMGLSREELNSPSLSVSKSFLGSQTAYFINSSSQDTYSKEIFYDVGTYQHILFACGINKENEVFTEKSEEWNAYREFHQEFEKNILNPWHGINKDDLFEYHLANIFSSDSELKEKVLATINFYNPVWEYYKESFNFYDHPNQPRVKFSDKQKYLPGENQMLAYFFSSELRFIWAASIGFEALTAITELEEDLGKYALNALKKLSWVPFVPSPGKILKAAQKKHGVHKQSFLDVWSEVKEKFHILTKEIDFVTFSSHGCVISFDPHLIKMQHHENKEIGEKLGFEMWESLYEKGLKPFYQKKGTEKNILQFN